MIRVHAALFTVQILFGSWPVAGAAVLELIAPPALIGFRTLLGAPLLLLAARPWRAMPTRQDLLALVGLAFLGVSANQLIYVEGLQRAGPVNAVVLITLIPALTVLLAVLLGRERPSSTRVAGIIIAMGAAAMLVGVERFDLSDERIVGSLLILTNSTLYAGYLVLARPVINRVGTLRTVAWVFAFGAIEALPWTGPAVLQTPWTDLPNWAWGSLLFILAGPTVGAYLLNAAALKRVDSSVVAVYVYLQPIVGTCAAWFVLGQVIEARTAICGAVICVGVWFATRKPR